MNLDLVNKVLKNQYESFVINDKTVDLEGPGIKTRILKCMLEELIINYKKLNK